jgi:hypothetical protein
MAIFRFRVNIIKRSQGQSAVASAAYRAGDKLRDQRIEKDFDYGRRAGVAHTEIRAPANAPVWCRDRDALWNAAERASRRGDDQPARELVLALPHELSEAQRLEALRGFVDRQFVARGMVADIAVHLPGKEGDERNHHAHVMLSMREIGAEGFGNKVRDWNSRALVREWRKEWANELNQVLERAGNVERVDHRSNKERGLAQEPLPKLSRDEWRHYARLRADLRVIDREMGELERRQRRAVDDRSRGDMVSENRAAMKRFRNNSRELEERPDKLGEEQGAASGPRGKTDAKMDELEAYLRKQRAERKARGRDLAPSKDRSKDSDGGREM